MRLIGSLCIYFGRLGGWAGRPRDGRLGGSQGGVPGATEAIAQRFFDFLRDVPRGMLGFEAISDQGEGRPGGRLEEVFSHISLSAGSCRRDFRTKRPQLLTTLSAKWASRLFENICVLLAAPRSNSKSVNLAGTVCKNSDELICYGGFWKSSREQSG